MLSLKIGVRANATFAVNHLSNPCCLKPPNTLAHRIPCFSNKASHKQQRSLQLQPPSYRRLIHTTSILKFPESTNRDGSSSNQLSSDPYTYLSSLQKDTKDKFDWGTVKEQIFGDFGRPSPQEPIQRVSYIPDRLPDEKTIHVDHEPHIDVEHIRIDGTGLTWESPMVPKPRPTLIRNNTVEAVGRRKRATATVRMTPGTGKIVINDRHWLYYFKDAPVRNIMLEPLLVTECLNKWDIDARVRGGGFSGQSGAIRLAISRALLRWDPELQPPLKKAGFLTRDKREVERKKPGRRKARRSFQWVKR